MNSLKYIADKSYLGLAVEEIASELQLHDSLHLIRSCFHEAFAKNYEQSVVTRLQRCSRVTARIIESKETSLDNSTQYYQAVLYDLKFHEAKNNEITFKHKAKPLALLEAFSFEHASARSYSPKKPKKGSKRNKAD